jgi:long-chain acyl-CoA synthetase
MPETIVNRFFRNATGSPGKPAVILKETSLSYSDLARLAGKFLALLASVQVTKGDRVILSASNTPDFIAGYLATHLSGAICAPVDPDTSPSNVNHIVSTVAPKIILSDKKFYATGTSEKSFAEVCAFDEVDLSSLLEKSEAITGKSAADILFTSGTTGKPKGVVLTHSAIAAAADHINQVIGLSTDDVEVIPLPLCHSFGLGRLRCLLSKGASLVLEQGFANPKRVIESLHAHQATGFSSVPAGLLILLKFFKETFPKLSHHLKYIEIGSAPMPLDSKIELLRALPETKIFMHYGLTEASRSSFLNLRSDQQAMESVGKPSPNVDIRIVDQHGSHCKPMTRGQIEIKGPHIFDRYWKDPSNTGITFSNGWVRSGDIGYFDDKGYLYLVSRESEMINIAGRKVAPQEVEKILESHPGILSCGCIGIPDPDGITGSLIIAFIVPQDNLESPPKLSDIAKFARSRLEPYKLPSRYIWTETLPKTESGKIKRFILAEQFLKTAL